jgi:hypothetical protein
MAERVIPDRGEFVDTLNAMLHGHVLVRVSEMSGGCVVNGFAVYHSFETLRAFALLEEFENPEGFAEVHYFRLSDRGREFAREACAQWRAQPLLRRLSMRLLG